MSLLKVAQTLGISPPTAMRAVHRFLAEGEAGLVDRRAENGSRKVDDDFLAVPVL
jgi:transposase